MVLKFFDTSGVDALAERLGRDLITRIPPLVDAECPADFVDTMTYESAAAVSAAQSERK
jgi:hypothetical protein